MFHSVVWMREVRNLVCFLPAGASGFDAYADDCCYRNELRERLFFEKECC